MNHEHHLALEREGNDVDRFAKYNHMGVISTYNAMLAATMQKIIPTISDSQREMLREYGYYDLTENAVHTLNCAMLLAVRCVNEATAYAESCGGGGFPSLSRWERDKDEDDERWWKRCIATAAAMVKPRGRRRPAGGRRW